MGEFYKMEYDAWDEGTVELSLEEEAAYLRLCHQMYRRRQPVPVYDRMLCALWRCHQNKARPLLQRLIDKGKITLLPDGRVTNGRVAREIDARETLNRNRAHAGHTGGIRSVEARRKSLENNDPPQAESSRGEEKRGEERREEKNPLIGDMEADASRPDKPKGKIKIQTSTGSNLTTAPTQEPGGEGPSLTRSKPGASPPKRTKNKPLVPLPDDFILTAERAEVAIKQRLDADETFTEFRSWMIHKAERSAAWDVRWTMWVARQVKINAKGGDPEGRGMRYLDEDGQWQYGKNPRRRIADGDDGLPRYELIDG